MKFKDKVTGNTLETKNEKAIELMKGNPDKYETVNTFRAAKKAATAKAEKAED